MVKKILDYHLFTFGKYEMDLINILGLVVFIILFMIFLRVIKIAVYRSKNFDASRKYSIFKLVKYLYFIIGGILSLKILGFDLSLVLAGSAALLVGFGLGIQNLFSDYVSGIIILFDHSVKVNDLIEVNGIICKVKQIKLRTTTVITSEDKYIILPNTELTRNHVVNWTLNEKSSRFDVSIHVDYSSNLNLVKELMLEAVAKNSSILTFPAPFVRMNNIADSSLMFTIYFWTEHAFNVDNIKSDLRFDIFNLFKEKGIKIPYPQRMVYSRNLTDIK